MAAGVGLTLNLAFRSSAFSFQLPAGSLRPKAEVTGFEFKGTKRTLAYKSLVLAGANYHGLPASYIAGIEAVASVQDTNKKRREDIEALLRGMNALPQGFFA